MSEENKRGRKSGSTKNVGYIQVNDKLRIKVEEGCLTIEELISKDAWGKGRYYNSWDGVLNYLIRKFTADNMSKKEVWTFAEARQEILDSIKEVKDVLLGEIQEQVELASEEIKQAINKILI